MRPNLTFLFLLGLIATLFGRPAFAIRLSWEECVRRAIENNAELKANLASVASVKEQENVARGGYFPQLNAEFKYLQQNDSAKDTVDVTKRFYSGILKLNQNLFAGFQDIERLGVAKENSAAARAGLRNLKSQVSYALKQAYETYIYAKGFQKLTADIIKRREENLSIVELRFQGGGENKGSVLLSRANLNLARFDDLQAKNIREVARVQLRKALGLDENDEVDVDEDIPIKNWNTKSPDFVRMAEEVPDYIQSLAQLAANDHAIAVAQGAFYPQVNLIGETGTIGGDFYPKYNHWAIGVNINLPLFNGGKDYAATQAAVYNKAQTENQRVNINRDSLVKLHDSYTKLIEAIEKLKVDASFREAAMVRAEIARKKYNNGLLSFEDWDIIENDLINRQKNYLTSGRDRIINEAGFEQAQGTGVIR
jgi:outer membrane protein TolC